MKLGRLAKSSMTISAEKHVITIKTKSAFKAPQSPSHWVRSSMKPHDRKTEVRMEGFQ